MIQKVPFGMKRFLIILSTLVYFACSNDVKLTLISQEEKIDTYLANNKFNDTSQVIRNKGVNRLYLGFVHDYIITDTIISGRDTTYITQEVPIKDTVYIDYGDSIYISYAGYVFTSAPSSLFATNVAEVASKAGWDMSKVDTTSKGILFEEGALIPGLEYGLHNAREKEHCLILFSAEYGFGNIKMYNIPKLSALSYEIIVDKVVKKSDN